MLKVYVEESSDVAVLYFKGNIVVGVDTTQLQDAGFSHRAARIVILDVSRVDKIEAAGLGALLEVREWAQAKGIELKLVNPTRLVYQVFAIARLDSGFDISFQEDVLSEDVPSQIPPIAAAPSQRARSKPLYRVARRVRHSRSATKLHHFAYRSVSKKGSEM